jgi:hypothetical protein
VVCEGEGLIFAGAVADLFHCTAEVDLRHKEMRGETVAFIFAFLCAGFAKLHHYLAGPVPGEERMADFVRPYETLFRNWESGVQLDRLCAVVQADVDTVEVIEHEAFLNPDLQKVTHNLKVTRRLKPKPLPSGMRPLFNLSGEIHGRPPPEMMKYE